MIPEELADFLPTGLSIVVATRDRENTPNGARACAAVVEEDRRHLTVYLHASGAERIMGDLQDAGAAAVLFVRPTDSRACQLKGTFVDSRRARPTERAEIERQAEGFRRELEGIGIPQALTAGWARWPCVAVRVRVTDLFHQTPGPGAGERLR